MRIPIKQLPPAIRERLEAIQANPTAYDCFYRRQGGVGGGIFGLVVAGLGAIALLIWAVNDYMPAAVGIIAGLLIGAITWGSIGRIRRVRAAALRPAVLVNPLYFARITLDQVTFHGLWSELRDLKITHHHTNGVYSFTNFEFFFKSGIKEALAVSPKRVAEQLADLIEQYRVRMIQAIESQNVEAIIGHDLFLEARTPDEQGREPQFGTPAGAGRGWAMAFGVGGAAGAVAGFALFFLSYASAQSRQIDYCYGVSSCQYYFDDWALPLYTERAQQKLTDTYKREWEQNKKSVRKLRLMAQLEHVDHVTPAQAKEILALYRDGSQKELRARYQQAIDKYKAVSAAANPQARASLIKMLELARDSGYYRVKVSYKGITEKIKGPIDLPAKARGRTLVPMGPSFSDRLNESRQGLITERIHRAFMDIVPQDVLEFPGLNTRTYSTGGSSRYRRYDSASVRYGALARKLGVKDPQKEDKGPAELEFVVAYVVFPSGSLYVSRKNPSQLYMGIGFDWLVRIKVKDQTLYTLRQQSYPPPRFTVTSYGSRYAPAVLGAGTVYSKMATTAFDDFSKNIVKHFGIPVTSRPPAPRVRNVGARDNLGDLRRRIQERLRKRLGASASSSL